MRRNFFNEAYCSSAEEVRAVLDESGRSTGDVHATNLADADALTEQKAAADVLENDSGEVVCRVEALSLAEVRAIVAECELEVLE